MIIVGNQVQIGIVEFGCGLLDDLCVIVLGLYIEGFGDLCVWEEFVVYVKFVNKLIVVIKVGKFVQVQVVIVFYIVLFVGGDVGVVVFLKCLGIVWLDDFVFFFEMLKLLYVIGFLFVNIIVIMSCLGGEVSFVVDMVYGCDFVFLLFNDC